MACPAGDEHMTPSDQGAFCKLCEREVVDVSGMTEAEVLTLRDERGGLCISAMVRTSDRSVLLRPEAERGRRTLPIVGALGALALVACAPEVVAPPPRPAETGTAPLRPDTPYELPAIPETKRRVHHPPPVVTSTPLPENAATCEEGTERIKGTIR